MKRIWLMMALAATLSFGAACHKDEPKKPDNSNQVTPSTPVTPVTPETPSTPDEPTPPPKPQPKPESVKLVVKTGGGNLKSVELTASGQYIICQVDSKNHKEYSTGDYTIDSDGQFVLGDDGVLTYTQGSATTDFTFKAKDGKEVSGKADVKTPASTSSNLTKLCRTWTITKTRIKITKGATASMDFDGCDLGEIADFVRKQGIEIKKDLKDFKLTSITVTPTGTAMINYSDGSMDVANLDLSAIDKGTLKYSWPDVSALGYEFTNGTGSVKFDGDNCAFSVASSFVKDSKKYDVSVTFAMTEKK